jgi:glycosyltransferase involved in cell wall biosynthesis
MSNLKILHLLSNWKWTEISEPAVDLALAQQKLGAQVEFVCGRGPADRSQRRVDYHARRKKLDAVHVLEMPKHLRAFAAYRDGVKLRSLLKRFQPDVIHCHKANAHLVGFLSRGFSKPPLIVRSCYDAAGPQHDFRSRLLYRFGTEGLVVINEKSRLAALGRTGLAPESVQAIEPGIDVERFSPQRKIADDPPEFGLKPDAFVVGIVSRIRESRRLDIVLQAIRTLAQAFPQLQMLLVGRGREGAVEMVVAKPARQMGISDRIVLAGYCEGDSLVAAYRAMDVLVYPSPGSDQSCRTVREAMAAGLPVIAPGIGFLPELIEDHVSGRLMGSAGENLAPILQEMMQGEAKLRDMGRRSLEASRLRFSPRLQAERTLNFYQKLLKRYD